MPFGLAAISRCQLGTDALRFGRPHHGVPTAPLPPRRGPPWKEEHDLADVYLAYSGGQSTLCVVHASDTDSSTRIHCQRAWLSPAEWKEWHPMMTQGASRSKLSRVFRLLGVKGNL